MLSSPAVESTAAVQKIYQLKMNVRTGNIHICDVKHEWQLSALTCNAGCSLIFLKSDPNAMSVQCFLSWAARSFSLSCPATGPLCCRLRGPCSVTRWVSSGIYTCPVYYVPAAHSGGIVETVICYYPGKSLLVVQLSKCHFTQITKTKTVKL